MGQIWPRPSGGLVYEWDAAETRTVRTRARTEDWGNSIDDFFAQTFIHTIVSDAELLRS